LTGQPGEDRWDNIDRTGQPGQDTQDKPVVTGQPLFLKKDRKQILKKLNCC
jgi:hypothetical protein